MRGVAVFGFLVLLGFASASSHAQESGQTPAPVPSEPQSTSAAYGDWLLRCSRQGEGDAVRRVCEAAQTIQLQGQQAPIAQIAVGRVKAGDPLIMTILLPPNIGFPSSVKISVVENDPAPLDAPWKLCSAGACVATVNPQQAFLDSVAPAAQPGRIAYVDAAGRPVSLPLSWRGLAQALAALEKEAQ